MAPDLQQTRRRAAAVDARAPSAAAAAFAPAIYAAPCRRRGRRSSSCNALATWAGRTPPAQCEGAPAHAARDGLLGGPNTKVAEGLSGVLCEAMS